MLRSIAHAAAIAALCSTATTPAFAEEFRYSGFDAPHGATAMLNFKVPLGANVERSVPTYGLTLGYGHTVGTPTMDGRTTTRAVRLADLRFDTAWRVHRAELATYDLANLDKDRRLNMAEDGDNTWLIVGGLIAGGLVICLLADCFEGDDDDDDPMVNPL